MGQTLPTGDGWYVVCPDWAKRRHDEEAAISDADRLNSTAKCQHTHVAIAAASIEQAKDRYALVLDFGR